MPELCLVGSIKGSYLHNFAELCQSIVNPLSHFQLRIPTNNHQKKLEVNVSHDISEENYGMVDFSRPSDFRLKAIEANYSTHFHDDNSNANRKSSSSKTHSPSPLTTTKTGNTPYEGNANFIFH